MPGALVTVGSQISCPHQGSCSPVTSNTRVLAGGAAVLTLADQYTISGCPFQIPVGAGTKPQPCVRIQWTVGATRVRVGGQPALIQSSVGLALSAESIPGGPPVVVPAQTRAMAT
jgi:hypothetical protein